MALLEDTYPMLPCFLSDGEKVRNVVVICIVSIVVGIHIHYNYQSRVCY